MASYIAIKLSDSGMKDVNASIITIGDELLIGQTIDTNSAFIAQELNKIGIWVKRRIAIGDVKKEILSALEEQGRDCDVVIITGGLGPTADDITKPVLCEFFSADLVVDEGALQNVKDIFNKLNRPLTERNLKQAEVPNTCKVLPNLRGTAPGMWFGPWPFTDSPAHRISSSQDTIYISLPGVPHEMKGLVIDSVIPALKELLDLPAVVHKTLLTSGIGESYIADMIEEFENRLPAHVKLAYLPAYGLVRLRLTCKANTQEQAEKEVSKYFEQLKPLVKQWMVADKDISLAQALIDLLRVKKKKVSTAESCTGGHIAHLITTRAGASDVYNGSVVAYAYEAKENVLGVQKETLDRFGAVSEQTVTEMIKGVLNTMETDYAMATSGIMGPGGGTPEKPTGTVWIAVGNRQKTKAFKAFFRFDRERNIELTAHTAISLLYRFIMEEEGR